MFTSNMIHPGKTTNTNASRIIICSDYQGCQFRDVDIKITHVKKSAQLHSDHSVLYLKMCKV